MPPKQSVEPKLIKGRGGVKLPAYEWREMDAPYQIDNFMRFFHAFWAVNGIKLEKTVNTGAQRQKPVGFFHELVLPPAADKPLTVVRARYDPRYQPDIAEDCIIDNRRNDYDRSGVNVGMETHELLIPPRKTGPFKPVLDLNEIDRRGGSSFGSDARLEWQGERIYRSTYEASHDEYPNIYDWHEASRISVGEGLRTVLAQVVEFMS